MTNNDYILEKSEILEMLDKTNDKELQGIIAVLILTGARISEVLSLTGKDIWTDENYLYLRMPLLKKRKQKFQKITRKVPKDGIFVNYFRNYVNQARIVPEEKIFKCDRRRVWERIKALNPNIKVHTFRHTLATWMGQKVDMRTLQNWMGWENLNMAKIYVNPKDSINRFAQEMEELMQ